MMLVYCGVAPRLGRPSPSHSNPPGTALIDRDGHIIDQLLANYWTLINELYKGSP
jgi:hypothetical protein